MPAPNSEPPHATEAEAPPPVQSGSEPPKAEKIDHEEEEEEEEEEEGGGGGGECGFCLYMKAGGCRDAFTDWEKCIEEAEENEEDLVEKCAKITAVLKQCMESHSDYYQPILRAEKAEAIDELEKEKEAEDHNAPKDGASGSKSNDEK